jgi:hypothetical protein
MVLQCQSTNEKNDENSSTIKYDEKIMIEEFYSVNEQKGRTIEVIWQSFMMRK